MRGAFFAYIAFIAAIISGWVLNLIALFGADTAMGQGEFALRIIGVFLAPIGAFMGWFI